MRRIAIPLLLLALTVAGCSDPKKALIPSDPAKWETELTPILDRLSTDDKATVLKYTIRMKFGEIFGGKSKLGQVTVGEAIADQKRFEAEEAAKEEADKRLAEKLKADRQALEQLVRDTLSVVLVDKGYRKADPLNGGSFTDQITFTLGFQNRGSKAIAGCKGILIFKDMFGDTIKRLTISRDESIAAGQSLTWDGTMDYNEFMASDKKLLDADPSKIQLDFEAEAIVFADGTKIEAPPKSDSSPWGE